MEFEIPASQKDPGLPMIVNLRGDEDLIEEFTWDADQAMEFLGIKRSRLTQISGKELRVGRVRRDRYLRPVFREIDLRDYQEWTRATATHQSSSRAIEQAIDSLDDRFSDLFVILQEKLQQLEDRSGQMLRTQLQQLDKSISKRFQSADQDLRDQQQVLLLQIFRGQQKLHKAQLQQNGTMQTLQAEIQELRGLFGQFHQDLRTLLLTQVQLRKDQHSAFESAQLNETIRQKDQQQQLDDLHGQMRELQASCQQISEQQQLPVILPRAPMLKPRRKRVKALPLRGGRLQTLPSPSS